MSQAGAHGSHESAHGENGDRPRIARGFRGEITPPPAPAAHGEGPVVTDSRYEQYLAALAENPLLTEDNIRVPERAAGGVARALMVVGAVGIVLTLLAIFAANLAHALAAYMVGVFSVLACSLGAMFLVMVLHAVNAQWSTTVRRQLENVMALTWVPVLMMVPIVVIELVGGGVLLLWLRSDLQTNYLLEHKDPYLNGPFFALRFVLYAAVWIWLSRSLYGMSREQDITGDRWLTRRMRRLGTFGLLLFALSVPFAAFDFLMSLDYRFFSTMWGVYYFAGAAMSGVAITGLVLAILRLFGRLTGVVTKEHFHDLGKLLFAFTVFWAYIAFSQYFLIWYGNIPEETAWFLRRTVGAWAPLAVIIVLGHFIVPFFLLISRKTKRNTVALGLMAGFLLVMQVLDMVFIIRPMVYIGERAAEYDPSPVLWIFDVAAVLGVAGLFGGLLAQQVASGPLVPIKDPRLGKALAHKNYV